MKLIDNLKLPALKKKKHHKKRRHSKKQRMHDDLKSSRESHDKTYDNNSGEKSYESSGEKSYDLDRPVAHKTKPLILF